MNDLNIALKEWDSVIRALGVGRQVVLLRKGGISDEGGVFRLERERFLLYPTFEHQQARFLSEEGGGLLRWPANPAEVDLEFWAEVADIRAAGPAADWAAFLRETVWSRDHLDQRLRYKPEKPLYAVTLRVYRLPSPVRLEVTAEQRGCVSWVPLSVMVPLKGSVAVLPDAVFEARKKAVSVV